jgi:hypothetical protein
LQTKEEFLEGKCAGCLQSHGWILNQALSSSVLSAWWAPGFPCCHWFRASIQLN